MTIWRMCIVCWIPKATDTHSEYVMRTLPVGGSDSVVGIATGYGLDGPGIESLWRRDFPHLSCPGAHPASCKMGTCSFPGVKSGRGVTLTRHPLLVPRSRKGRAIPLLPLWAVRPVQSLSACTGVHFTFFFFYIACPVSVISGLKMLRCDKVVCVWTAGTLETHVLSTHSWHLV